MNKALDMELIVISTIELIMAFIIPAVAHKTQKATNKTLIIPIVISAIALIVSAVAYKTQTQKVEILANYVCCRITPIIFGSFWSYWFHYEWKI